MTQVQDAKRQEVEAYLRERGWQEVEPGRWRKSEVPDGSWSLMSAWYQQACRDHEEARAA